MKRNVILLSGILITLVMMLSCSNEPKYLTSGRWRGVFQANGHEFPFVFQVSGDRPQEALVELINGEERFQLKGIRYSGDSVTIPVDLFDAAFVGKSDGYHLQGRFRKLATEKPDPGIPFVADAGDLPRFPEGAAPAGSLDGSWDLLMGEEKPEATVGNFVQKGSKVTGSILTNTGDFRYLEGVVQGSQFMLSAFSGSSPYLLTGKFESDSLFTGEFITARKMTKLTAKRNPKAALQDPYSFSKLKEGAPSVQFSFPNLKNEQVSLADPRYKGKVVLVTVMGSWCPNCMDEAAFLAPWYKANRDRGVEIIGLAFERKNDFAFAQKVLTRLKERFDIQYELLFAGLAGTDNASKALPALTGIAAFPSTLFIDKKGQVRKVHTGFSGPATGRYYTAFQEEFNALVDTLLKE
ncbi:MAG: TlpA family protein disulfide reductase [Marinilabiliales bacterium]|nr:TlpA family protein disulfide reductase [Marinilabiliales bacterium]